VTRPGKGKRGVVATVEVDIHGGGRIGDGLSARIAFWLAEPRSTTCADATSGSHTSMLR